MKRPQKPIPFQNIIKALLDDENTFPTRYLYRLSDINLQELDTLEQTWPKIPLRRRQTLMVDIQDLNEEDFMLNFVDLGMMAVQDPDTQVRLTAVLVLAEYGGEELIPLFIRLAEQDQEMEVRAAAVAAMGGLVQQGELEELPAASLKQLEACLLRILDGQDAKRVRLNVLESLGYSNRDEAENLIKNAYQFGDADWLASSLIAMGRSYNQAWNADVTAKLRDKRTIIRLEAVRAAGELEIADAAPTIKELLLDEENSVREAAIWSLSQIGGADVRSLFERMLEASEIDEEIELLEDALENLDFTEGFPDLSLFDVDDEEEEAEEEDIDED